MRIVGGKYSGRKLQAPKGRKTRPSPERLREGLASALVARDALAGARLLDLFAGTGAMSLELLSRGLASAVAVDRASASLRLVAQNAAALGVPTNTLQTLQCDLFRAPEGIWPLLQGRGPFDLVFVDPPYAEVEAVLPLLEAIPEQGIVAKDAILLLEHATAQPPKALKEWTVERSYRYGDSSFLLASPTGGMETEPLTNQD